MSGRLLSGCLSLFVQNNKNSGVLPLSLILEWVTMLRPREHAGLSGHLPELEVHPLTFHEAAEGRASLCLAPCEVAKYRHSHHAIVPPITLASLTHSIDYG